jgi:Helicase HerA, central domain
VTLQAQPKAEPFRPSSDKGRQVAIVGSPSSNGELTLNLTEDAYEAGLVGALVYVQPEMGDGEELAIGTVTEVTTTNQWHQNASLLGVVKTVGEIPGLTREGDIRTADVRLQASYRRLKRDGEWVKNGPSLSLSPSTGTTVLRVTNSVIQELLTASERESLAYLGKVYRNENLILPINMRDFADDRGAVHVGVFGTTGSGKSAMACLLLACQMRHEGLAMLLIDPQGQFSSDRKTIMPLQSLARILGREVHSLRISHDIQLRRDPALLCSMLAKTEFFARLDASHQATVANVSRVIRDLLEDQPDWVKDSDEKVLHQILDTLDDDETITLVIKNSERQAQIRQAVQQAKSGPAWNRLRSIWRPLHSLFTSRNLVGGRRKDLWGVLSGVLQPSGTQRARNNEPRPYVVIDMSPSREREADSDSDFSLLEDEGLKAELLYKIVGTLRAVAEQSYQDEAPLNTLIMFDEAHRYAPPIRADLPEETSRLSKMLDRCARETRKYGVGWAYITQNIRGLNPSIFDMLGVRICGYGLGSSDLRVMADHVDSQDSLNLYSTFANPDQTESYPYMIAGPFSPLSFTKAPLFLTSFEPDEWFQFNSDWIRSRARRGRLPNGPLTVEALGGRSLSKRAELASPDHDSGDGSPAGPGDASRRTVRSSLDRQPPS